MSCRSCFAIFASMAFKISSLCSSSRSRRTSADSSGSIRLRSWAARSSGKPRSKPCSSSSSISSSASAASSGSKSSISALCSRPARSSMRSAKSAGRSWESAVFEPEVFTTPDESASEATVDQSKTCCGVALRPRPPGKIRRRNVTKEISTPTTRISLSSGAKYKSEDRTTRSPFTSTI